MLKKFQNIFNVYNLLSKNIIQEKIIKLYFTEDKLKFYSIKINNKLTCKEIYNENINEISKYISKLIVFEKKEEFLNPEENFVIINDLDKNTRIKLKSKNVPFKYLTNKNINLYYLPIIKKINFFEENFNNDLFEKHQVINIINPENCIKEDLIKKYSFINKKFENRILIIDNIKIILKENREQINFNGEKEDLNLWHIFLYINIKKINKGTNENNINEKNSSNIFEILTNDGELIIIKTRNSYERNDWVNKINNLLNHKEYLIILQNSAKNLKELYENNLKILLNLFNVKGILANEMTRKNYFEVLNNKFLENILENIINYRLSIYNKNYFEGIKFFIEIIKIFDIKNLKNNLKKEIDFEKINPINNLNINKDFLLNYNIISFEILESYKKLFFELNKEINLEENNKLILSNLNIEYLKNKLTINLFNILYDNIIQKLLNNNYKNVILKQKEYKNKLEFILYNNYILNNNFNFLNYFIRKKKNNY